jgi:hypothetical protein
MNRARISLAGLLAGTALCLGVPAFATPVTPGMPSAALTTGSLTGYTEVANTGPETYNSCANNDGICGQYDEAVFQNTSNGTLDFVYQFSNGANQGDTVDAVSVQNFFGDAVAAYYTNTVAFLGTPGCTYTISGGIPVCQAGGTHSTNITPVIVNESPNGEVLNFDYSYETGFSNVLIVQTDATQYRTGTFAIQDGLNYNSQVLGLPAFEPVPEPGFYGVVGIGLAGILSLKLRRRATN